MLLLNRVKVSSTEHCCHWKSLLNPTTRLSSQSHSFCSVITAGQTEWPLTSAQHTCVFTARSIRVKYLQKDREQTLTAIQYNLYLRTTFKCSDNSFNRNSSPKTCHVHDTDNFLVDVQLKCKSTIEEETERTSSKVVCIVIWMLGKHFSCVENTTLDLRLC